jgi:aromatic ring-opening dioxygenase catalytic subunit (LigB family)
MLAAATVHFPYMTAWPEQAQAAHREATHQGFARIGKAFADAGVDTLIVLTSEHIVNLQPRMAPAFLIGTGAVHESFPEPQFRLEPVARPGDPELAHALVEHLYAHGLDPAHSSELRLDHGTTLPLQQLKIPADIRVVPVIINTLFPPLPTLKRCRELGAAIAQALPQTGMERRVGILATGGISHAVGEPGMDRIDPPFDAQFVAALVAGDLNKACAYSDSELDAKGNGTHEIRSWIAAAAAAQPSQAKVVTAIPYAPGWYTGVHQMLWEAP